MEIDKDIEEYMEDMAYTGLTVSGMRTRWSEDM